MTARLAAPHRRATPNPKSGRAAPRAIVANLQQISLMVNFFFTMRHIRETAGTRCCERDWAPFRQDQPMKPDCLYPASRLEKSTGKLLAKPKAFLFSSWIQHPEEVIMWNWIFGSGWR